MKAVEFYWSCPTSPMVWYFSPGTEAQAFWRRICAGDSRYPLRVRYDNGQLCTFRRKTKGQNNER